MKMLSGFSFPQTSPPFFLSTVSHNKFLPPKCSWGGGSGVVVGEGAV